MTNTINIFQKNWAFTSSNSNKPQIKTGSFGPCYVLTFTSGPWAAMAHLDTTTKVESLTLIFDKFKENSVSPRDVKVVIIGGWKENTQSFKWGEKIVAKIMEAGFEKVSTKNMYLKKALATLGRVQKNLLHNYYHFGALLDARSGKTFLLKELSTSMDEEQVRQSKEFYKKHFSAADWEVALTQVIS